MPESVSQFPFNYIQILLIAVLFYKSRNGMIFFVFNKFSLLSIKN
jgi:hypothetical protein